MHHFACLHTEYVDLVVMGTEHVAAIFADVNFAAGVESLYFTVDSKASK